jgi:acetyl esterase/lipase
VISITYSIAPKYVFPAAHNDVDDIVAYLLAHAADFGADPKLLTVGGSSVGGNLALSASPYLHWQGKPVPLAFVAWYPALSFHAPPQEKPKPEGYPTSDPMAFLLPLFDVYAGANRAEHIDDARLHPILAKEEALSRDMLIVSAKMDVLLAEGVEFVERMRKERVEGEGRVEVVLVKTGFHGFMECEYRVVCREMSRVDRWQCRASSLRESVWMLSIRASNSFEKRMRRLGLSLTRIADEEEHSSENGGGRAG